MSRGGFGSISSRGYSFQDEGPSDEDRKAEQESYYSMGKGIGKGLLGSKEQAASQDKKVGKAAAEHAGFQSAQSGLAHTQSQMERIGAAYDDWEAPVRQPDIFGNVGRWSPPVDNPYAETNPSAVQWGRKMRGR